MRVLDRSNVELSLDRVGFRSEDDSSSSGADPQTQRDRDRDGPDGFGQDDHALRGARRAQRHPLEGPHGRGPGRVRHRRPVPGPGELGRGADVRQGAALVPASGPRCDPRGRDPRPRDSADRRPGVAHGAPGAHDAAHQRRAEFDHPSCGPGDRAVPAHGDDRGHRRPASGPQARPKDQRGVHADREELMELSLRPRMSRDGVLPPQAPAHRRRDTRGAWRSSRS